MARRDNAPAKRRTKRQLTANQREWQHQVQNLKRRIKDLESLGAQVAFAIPEMPARVTKAAIEKIKNIRRAQLEKTAYQEGRFGEAVPFEAPERGKAEERRRKVRAEKWLRKELERSELEDEEDAYNYSESEPVEIYRVEIDNLRSLIYDIADEETAEKLNSMLDKAIAEKGTSSVADTIEKRYSELRETAQQAIKYRGLSKGAGAITSFAQILMSEPLSFGELADLERANDYNDNFEAP